MLAGGAGVLVGVMFSFLKGRLGTADEWQVRMGAKLFSFLKGRLGTSEFKLFLYTASKVFIP